MKRKFNIPGITNLKLKPRSAAAKLVLKMKPSQTFFANLAYADTEGSDSDGHIHIDEVSNAD